jgi:hypothetical protein
MTRRSRDRTVLLEALRDKANFAYGLRQLCSVSWRRVPHQWGRVDASTLTAEATRKAHANDNDSLRGNIAFALRSFSHRSTQVMVALHVVSSPSVLSSTWEGWGHMPWWRWHPDVSLVFVIDDRCGESIAASTVILKRICPIANTTLRALRLRVTCVSAARWRVGRDLRLGFELLLRVTVLNLRYLGVGKLLLILEELSCPTVFKLRTSIVVLVIQ